jgi:hypothetical protein
MHPRPVEQMDVHRRVLETLGLEVRHGMTVRAAQDCIEDDDRVEHTHDPSQWDVRAGGEPR